MIGIPDPEAWRAKIEKAESTVAEMKEELAGAVDALREIAKYDLGTGCCPYGCDTPHIAKTWLAHHDAGITK